ncbi:hypothetical protein N7449_006668 [Penicillium cf. viridicatum]|uniref:Uncharacterized protein n=1 Tax=Penicillium cf. viridicatum TaxID=2972119 RepID=A0A9W9JGX9_9EURO|nr:hypothetical protein N7449_006668 [Penicillium cf. viridicatum]
MIAAGNGHVEILQLFIDNLPSIITRSAPRSSHLLSHTAKRGQLDVVKFLMTQGTLVDYIDKMGRNNLVYQSTVTGGHLRVLKYLVEQSNYKDLAQDSALNLLHSTTTAGYLKIVKYLVNCGADFTRPPSGYISEHGPPSALETAIKMGHEDIASFFLNNAPPELLDAYLIPNETHARVPCGYPVSEKYVSSAAKKGETAIVLSLLRKAGKRDFKNLAKVALNAACSSDMFILLMQSVLDLLAKQDVETLISMVTSSTGPEASCGGHLEATKFLLDKGGNQPSNKIPKYFDVLRKRSKASTSFLEHAAVVCPVAQFQVALAQWNVELNPENDHCKAALVAAVLHKKAQTIQLFADKGFDLLPHTYIKGSSRRYYI